MPLFNMAELRAGLPPGGLLLGIDPGAKRVGLAISDARLVLATPRGAIPRGRMAAMRAALAPLLGQGVGGLVMGLPLSMDGSVGPAAQAARDFAHALSASLGLPAALWDERLSTAAAQRALLAADVSRARRGRVVDGMAAAWVLQAALDASRPPLD
jgi:putative Holliday junction resolvase